MHANAQWEGRFRTALDDARGHRVVVDLPVEEDGADAGASALELSVLSLAGCITTIFALVARRRHLSVESLRVELEAVRPRGARTITRVDGTARFVTRAPPAEIATALAITLRTCPVGVLFEQAGVPVHVEPRIVEPAAAAPASGD
ncbi:MAG TPA: OsmC family protein [Thermoplasmata archaeon]|nr:OsmC family protein [Thermoplasmata archaeon]